MIVLDTNVLSELVRAAPAAAVVSWFSRRSMSGLFSTTIVQAEMLLGVALLRPGRRREALEDAITGLFEDDFAGRILPFDGAAARAFADIASSRRREGRPISQPDAQIAAIVRSRGASLATRNVDDFVGCGVDVVNPWQS